MTKWHSGPPPSLGWWPCRFRDWFDSEVLRWWNGRCWSCGALETDASEKAAHLARQPSGYSTREIQWSARPESWPARSRT